LGDHALEDLAPDLWRKAIGRLNVRVALPQGRRASTAREALQILRSVEDFGIPAHGKTGEGFVPQDRWVESFVPLDVEIDRDVFLRPTDLQEVTLSFPAYGREGDWVQVALNVKTGEKGWLAIEPSAYSKLHLTGYDLDSPSDLTRWEGAADLLTLLREPFLRAYAGPSPRSPWTLLDPSWSPPGSEAPWSLSIRQIRNGFARVEARSCLAGEERAVSLGWVRLWDPEGHLLVWPTPGALGCC